MAFSFRGRTALVTGAANGIGRSLSLELALRGARTVLVDRDEQALEAVEKDILSSGGEALAITCDVNDQAAIDALVSTARRAGMSPDCLVNNAGIGSMGLFHELDIDEFQKVFAINFWGPLRLIRAFLPDLHAHSPSRIVNVSSVLGIIAAPDQSAYVASKFALRGLSESIAMELSGSSIGVTVVYPGGVATQITRRALIAKRLDPEFAQSRLYEYAAALKLDPAEAARLIANGVEREKARILIGRDCRAADRLQRLLPDSYWKILTKRLHAKSSGNFKRGTTDGAGGQLNRNGGDLPEDRPIEG